MKLFFFSSFIATLVVVASGVFVKRDGDYNFAVDQNVSYGTNAANVLDVYYDQNHIQDLKPVIIYLHGGLWYEGDKSTDSYIGTAIQNINYVAVLPNYRLYPEATSVDDMVEDIFNILLWTKSNIANYGGDLDQVTLAGFDAGAHLAALTVMKSAFNVEVNQTTLHKALNLKHLLLLNGQYTFEEFERFAYDISMMKENAQLSPALAYLENYANVLESIFLGKSGYDVTAILNNQDDQSVYSIGVEKVSFIECDKDAVVALGSSDELSAQLKRVVFDVELIKQVYQGKHTYVLDGIKNNDEEITETFLSLIKSPYEMF